MLCKESPSILTEVETHTHGRRLRGLWDSPPKR